MGKNYINIGQQLILAIFSLLIQHNYKAFINF